MITEHMPCISVRSRTVVPRFTRKCSSGRIIGAAAGLPISGIVPRVLRIENVPQVGWLAPSLQHRVDTTVSWVKRFTKLAPVTGLSMEQVRFDTQKLQNPEISGVEYQQGTLFGYEVREYLLEKWGRQCVYLGAENVPLEVEHIVPKARGGSTRISNRTLACHTCNQKKGDLPAETFLKKSRMF